MSEDKKVDETASFVTTSSDLPEVVKEVQKSDEVIDAKEEKNGDDATAETKKNGVQKRIDTITRQREDVKRENEALKLKLKEIESTKKSSEQKKEPAEDDYNTYDEYLSALDSFDNSSEKLENKKEKKVDKTNEEEIDLTDSQKTALAITQERVLSADKPKDFEEIASNPDLTVTGEMLEALAECDDPAKVMYHLGKNKELAVEISKKTPAQQMREIAKLDLSVDVKPQKPIKVTKAGEPISPVVGSDAQEKHVNDMSFSEYEAHMNKNEQKNKSW